MPPPKKTMRVEFMGCGLAEKGGGEKREGGEVSELSIISVIASEREATQIKVTYNAN